MNPSTGGTTSLERFDAGLPEQARPIGVVLNPLVDAWHYATSHPAYREHLATFGGSLDASFDPDRNRARSFFERQGWPYLDLHALMRDDPERYVLPEDGVHLNRTGHELFARKMFELIDTMLH